MPCYSCSRLQLLVFLSLSRFVISIEEPDAIVWPPSNPEKLLNSPDGSVDLALKPRIIEHPHNGKLANHYELLIKSLASNVKVDPKSSQLKRMVDMQQTLLQQPDRPQYDLYPQVLNMREVVKAVKYGLPVDEEPINDPPLRPIRYPTSACQQNTSHWPDLVIVVESCLDCENDRQHARETYMKQSLWTEFNVQFIFAVVLPTSNVSSIKPTDLQKLFPKLHEEAAKYNDLLIGGPVEPNMINTWTHIIAFRWVSIFCQERVPVFLFLHSKFSVVPQNLITFLRGIPQELQLILNAGLRPSTFKVARTGQPNPIDPEEVPWSRFPEHYNDTVFFVGAELLTQASITMAFTKPLSYSAAYLGFVWAKLDYPSLHLPHIIQEKGDWAEIYSKAVAGTEDLDKYIDWTNGYFFDPK